MCMSSLSALYVVCPFASFLFAESSDMAWHWISLVFKILYDLPWGLCHISQWLQWVKVLCLTRVIENNPCLINLKNSSKWLSVTTIVNSAKLPKLLQFDVPTTLSLTILAYLHAFSCYCVRNPRNPEKFTENSNLWSSRSSKVIDIGVNRKPICDSLLVINSDFSRICYRFRDIHG